MVGLIDLSSDFFKLQFYLSKICRCFKKNSIHRRPVRPIELRICKSDQDVSGRGGSYLSPVVEHDNGLIWLVGDKNQSRFPTRVPFPCAKSIGEASHRLMNFRVYMIHKYLSLAT